MVFRIESAAAHNRTASPKTTIGGEGKRAIIEGRARATTADRVSLAVAASPSASSIQPRMNLESGSTDVIDTESVPLCFAMGTASAMYFRAVSKSPVKNATQASP